MEKREEGDMMVLRPMKKTDLDETEKAFKMLFEFMQSHSEIEATIWAGAMWSCLVGGYIKSGVTYQEFCSECTGVMRHYKQWFDEEEE